MSPKDLTEWMSKNELTVNKLAPILGMSADTIVSYRMGRRPIPKWFSLALRGMELEETDGTTQH
jgi:hypothetical protein